MLKMVGKFAHHVMPGVIKPLHVLWNQVIGFFFLCLGLLAVPALVKELRAPVPSPRLLLMIPFVLIMAWFGVSSFWKARKASRR